MPRRAFCSIMNLLGVVKLLLQVKLHEQLQKLLPDPKRNYFWEKYFQSSLLSRKNWEYVDYSKLEKNPEQVDVVYSPNTRLNIKGDINGNMYQIVKTISDKVKINKLLAKTKIVPKMMFFNNGDLNGPSFEKKVT